MFSWYVCCSTSVLLHSSHTYLRRMQLLLLFALGLKEVDHRLAERIDPSGRCLRVSHRREELFRAEDLNQFSED